MNFINIRILTLISIILFSKICWAVNKLQIENKIFSPNEIISLPDIENCRIGEYTENFITSDDRCVCRQQIAYPYVHAEQPTKVLARINQAINDFIRDEVEYCDSENLLGDYLLKYELSYSEQVLTIFFTHSKYLGGPHPSYFIKIMNFNLTDGRLISFEEILKVNNEKLLNIELLSSLRQDERSYFYQGGLNQFNSLDQVDKKIIYDLEKVNFYSKDNKIIIVFSPYEVGPYVSGFIEIAVPNYFIINNYLNHQFIPHVN